jgi:acyl-CoA synthetase (AMP-forming)/AMP-acid ligase II
MGEQTLPGAAPLRATLLEHPDRTVLLDEAGRARTARELVDRVDRLAGTLAGQGLAGERVGVWYTNSIAAFEAYLSIEWIGATRLVLDPASAPAEASAILDAGGTRLTISDSAHAKLLDRPVMVHDDDSACRGHPLTPETAVPAGRALHLYPRGIRAGELHSVPIAYRNWAATIALNCRLYRSGAYGPGWDDADETLLTLQQLLHGTALLGSFPFLWMGRPQVVVSEFDPARVPDLIERFGVTATGMTSGMLSRLTREMGDRRLTRSSLRRVLYGGAPLAAADIQRASNGLGPVLVQIYGRLEGGWPLSILGGEDHAAILAGDEAVATSCGRCVGEGVELRVRPVAGQPEDVGELYTRSAMVVDEYADPDGWCALGDLASIDADERLYLHGRLDTMINTGYHVYPEQVEEALRSISGVSAARVRGESDARRGEVIVAYVVSEPGGGPTDADALREDLRGLLAPYKIPRRIHFVEQLPA